MLLGYADIEKSIRKSLGKPGKTCSGAHCGGYGYDIMVCLGKLRKLIAENRRKARLCFRHFTGNGIKSTDSVVLIRVLLGVCAALSLFAYNMHEHGRVHFLCPADDRFKLVNVMSVNGTEVIYAHRVEHI